MTQRTHLLLAFPLLLASMIGCSPQPDAQEDRDVLHVTVSDTLKRMYSEDSTLEPKLKSAAGYVVFPDVGKFGILVGGTYGNGELYEKSNFIGYADITQVTAGAQVGGQNFSEIIAFETPAAMSLFESGQFTFTANVSAVALRTGAAASGQYDSGVIVYVEPNAGLTVEAAIGGQRFSYQPK